MKPIGNEHMRELAERKSKAYGLLRALEENPTADDSCFQSLAQIVDQIQFHEISFDGGALDDLRELVTSENEDLASILAVLALALAEAEPDRGSIRVLLTGYPKWLRAVSGAARPAFLGVLPNIAVHLKELEESGVNSLVACLNLCPSAEDCEIVCGCVAKYQETSGKIVLAAAEIGSLAISGDSRPLVDKLFAAVSPDTIFDSKTSRELLPAMAKTGAKLRSAAVIGVCVAVAAENHSSALNLARHLESSLVSMTPETQLAYLNSFQAIIEEAGISLVGYGTKDLPALFQKAGEQRAAEFVAQGVAIARRYGRIAAEEFFEQKTASSRQAWPLG